MQVQVFTWGDDIGVPIPDPLAEQIGLREGQLVEAVIENGVLKLTVATSPPGDH
jgi:antitoxin component of MazEF toxin-antitoxin module